MEILDYKTSQNMLISKLGKTDVLYDYVMLLKSKSSGSRKIASDELESMIGELEVISEKIDRGINRYF
ncbi:MAG: hypothetical protein N4A54_04920 [Peptostreptococcaceae bacterium]|nr:hypothetical protein [Peptostreptococcaceae bacterium]